MKYIIKTTNLENLPDTRPLIAMDNSGNLIGIPKSHVPEGFVDFGLPSGNLWAKCNIGAENETEYGDYFAWGEIEPKINYTLDSYKYFRGSGFAKYNQLDNLTILQPEDDIAYQTNNEWRMPRQNDFVELVANTTRESVENYQNSGVNGTIFYKTIIDAESFIKNGVTLYMHLVTFDDVYYDPVELHEVSADLWSFFFEGATIEYLNAWISRLSQGEVTDIRTIIFTDPFGNTPAVYGVDYGFREKSVDTSINMFIPCGGYKSGTNIENRGEIWHLWMSKLAGSDNYSDALCLGVGELYGQMPREIGLNVRPIITVLPN